MVHPMCANQSSKHLLSKALAKSGRMTACYTSEWFLRLNRSARAGGLRLRREDGLQVFFSPKVGVTGAP